MNLNFNSNPRAPYVPTTAHRKLTAPDGKPLIVHVVVNVEYWPYDEPTPRTIVIPPHGRSVVPDLPNFSWAEYGNRAGMPRLLKLFGDRSIPVSASINASVIDVYPELAAAIRDLGWEFVGHGVRQRNLGTETDERSQIRLALDKLTTFCGRRPRGWMSPGWSETLDTLDYLKEAGVEYVCQWVIDDIPTRLRTKFGDVVSLPYGLDINDSVIFAIEKHASAEMARRIEATIATFQREIAETGQVRILAIPLHPHLSGVAHRIGYLTDTIDALLDRSDTVFMNGSQILDWYLAQSSQQISGVSQ
ncbi:MAG TPA: polysaccharide deacetylase family protein [Bauldia sp.]|nr:polysaccharide deacetylase family protein [Bauldia sp.]